MQSIEGNNLPELGVTGRDRLLSWTKTFVSLAPYAGPIIAELITEFIPQQRIERIAKYLSLLDARLSSVEQESLKQKMLTPTKADLFEEGAFQSTRSLSEERLEYIANLVATGITGEEKEEAESKRLLNILAGISDDQLIILASHLHKNQRNEFQNIHQDVLFTPPATLGSPQSVIDQSTISRLARQQLIALNLLRPNFVRPLRGEQPELDPETGMMKSNGYRLTASGRLLLRQIGLAGNDDY